MTKIRCVWILCVGLLSGCAHFGAGRVSAPEARADPETGADSRLAKAQLAPKNGLPLQGQFNFEQMPNSTLITYSLAGLRPKMNYQILVNFNSDCGQLDLSSAAMISQFRANKTGLAENTFKTEDFTVSRDHALLGHSILVVSQPSPEFNLAPQVACGPVLTRGL